MAATVPVATQQMSITQALAELKLLRTRLDSCICNAKSVTLKTKTRAVDVDEFSRGARSSFQSFRDLLNRYNRIKAAIVASNATARVSVAGREYTIAEAVERKRSLETEKEMLRVMKNQWEDVSESAANHQAAQQERLDKLLLQELGKDSKTSVEVVQALTDSFLKNNKAEVIDPLGLEARIGEMTRELEEFETNVDWVLSESNGRITITV